MRSHMNNKSAYVIGKSSKKQRRQFKNKCHEQGVPVCRALPLLMSKVIDGEITFVSTQKDVLVFNKK